MNSNGTSAAILVDMQTLDALDVYLSKQVRGDLASALAYGRCTQNPSVLPWYPTRSS